MPEFTVSWTATARGTCDVEADSEEEAMALVESGTAEGMEIENVDELSNFNVLDAEFFQN